MGISIAEFRVAMETYGAERLSDREGSRFDFKVPCFDVEGYEFLHSGSYYIVQRGRKVPDEIMNFAMAEFGEKEPGGDNFWYGEVHSVKGLLTLASMLEGKYSKELVNELTNTTYKKLLDCSLIKTNVEFPYKDNHSGKMKELFKKLDEYSRLVNPFIQGTFDLKEPIEYLDKLKLEVACKEECKEARKEARKEGCKEREKPFAALTLRNKSSNLKYYNNSDGWSYESILLIQKNRKNGYIRLCHYYTKRDENEPTNEVVRFSYRVGKGFKDHPDDIDELISLKTGLAWNFNEVEQALPVTDEQIKKMITYLNIAIKKIKKNFIRYMIK